MRGGEKKENVQQRYIIYFKTKVYTCTDIVQSFDHMFKSKKAVKKMKMDLL